MKEENRVVVNGHMVPFENFENFKGTKVLKPGLCSYCWGTGKGRGDRECLFCNGGLSETAISSEKDGKHEYFKGLRK